MSTCKMALEDTLTSIQKLFGSQERTIRVMEFINTTRAGRRTKKTELKEETEWREESRRVNDERLEEDDKGNMEEEKDKGECRGERDARDVSRE